MAWEAMVKILPSATEQTGDRQTLAIQARANETRNVANTLAMATRSLLVVGLAAVESTALTSTTVNLFVADRDYRVERAYLLPRNSLTASNTDYATITLAAAGLSGTASRTLATYSTTTAQGNWAVLSASAPKTFSVVAGAVLTTGEALRFVTTKTGIGIQVRECIVQIDLVPR